MTGKRKQTKINEIIESMIKEYKDDRKKGLPLSMTPLYNIINQYLWEESDEEINERYNDMKDGE